MIKRKSLLNDSPLNEGIIDKECSLKKVPTLQEFIKKTSSIKKTNLNSLNGKL
jgi:hypothetical protein